MSTTQTLNAAISPARPTGDLPVRNADEHTRLARISRVTTGRLRRSTLVTLRWTAIAGQVFALIIVYQVLGFKLPLWPAVAIIAISAIINIIVTTVFPLDRRASDMEALGQLGFDLFQLSALLWLTGGMSNPFALLFIAPVVTGATTLSKRVVLSLGALSAILSFGLLHYSRPLPWLPEGEFVLPYIFTVGSWIALLVGMVFTSAYAWRASEESRRMSEALAATEAVLAHEQKLSALGGMAAAAAHELGTPLATIQVTAKEMARELSADTPLGEDARLVHSQAERCRDILQQLAYRGDEGDMVHDALSLQALIEETVDPFFGFGPNIDVSVNGETPAPVIERQAELLYGLKNFIENAMDFANTQVDIIGSWTETHIEIAILDNGPGFDPTVKDRLGEPYVTSRPDKSNAGGLGLGFFIAKTLIERTGGRVKFGNRQKGGAFVKLRWPRATLTTPTIR